MKKLRINKRFKESHTHMKVQDMYTLLSAKAIIVEATKDHFKEETNINYMITNRKTSGYFMYDLVGESMIQAELLVDYVKEVQTIIRTPLWSIENTTACDFEAAWEKAYSGYATTYDNIVKNFDSLNDFINHSFDDPYISKDADVISVDNLLTKEVMKNKGIHLTAFLPSETSKNMESICEHEQTIVKLLVDFIVDRKGDIPWSLNNIEVIELADRVARTCTNVNPVYLKDFIDIVYKDVIIFTIEKAAVQRVTTNEFGDDFRKLILSRCVGTVRCAIHVLLNEKQTYDDNHKDPKAEIFGININGDVLNDVFGRDTSSTEKVDLSKEYVKSFTNMHIHKQELIEGLSSIIIYVHDETRVEKENPSELSEREINIRKAQKANLRDRVKNLLGKLEIDYKYLIKLVDVFGCLWLSGSGTTEAIKFIVEKEYKGMCESLQDIDSKSEAFADLMALAEKTPKDILISRLYNSEHLSKSNFIQITDKDSYFDFGLEGTDIKRHLKWGNIFLCEGHEDIADLKGHLSEVGCADIVASYFDSSIVDNTKHMVYSDGIWKIEEVGTPLTFPVICLCDMANDKVTLKYKSLNTPGETPKIDVYTEVTGKESSNIEEMILDKVRVFDNGVLEYRMDIRGEVFTINNSSPTVPTLSTITIYSSEDDKSFGWDAKTGQKYERSIGTCYYLSLKGYMVMLNTATSELFCVSCVIPGSEKDTDLMTIIKDIESDHGFVRDLIYEIHEYLQQ